ncbi:PREDICTED: uncharacterized protein C10orf62 homolog [Miniopterus natalensis]|uniref:uncharacterized protein C10orf62 homolog n=1 Tax=Miniopterus natalensis TaxID=291302 RepID=UPI0007A6D780|nr:PREDICTED: uncharacterized protein C10orf62 homolog [Miniopterus natalensis]
MGALENFLELIQQPSCKVVLGTVLLLGGGGFILWLQKRRRRKVAPQSPQGEHEPQEGHKAQNESWIKSHFSRLSEEKLSSYSSAASASSSIAAPQPEAGPGAASATMRTDTATSREPLPSQQRLPGSSGARETHKEPSSTDEATWAAVAASTKEIDTKGRQVANSMLQRATVYQNSGHVDSRDISQEELKALEEVEIKLKNNFLTQRETTVAGVNHTHTFHGHSHQDHPSHQSHQSHHSLPSRSNQTYHPFQAT